MHTTFPINLLQTAIASGIALAGSVLGFSVAGTAPASAATFTYAGTTTPGGPTFQAITAFDPTPFSVFHFRVSTTADYNFSGVSTGWQNVISLYRNVFNPSNNFTNLLNSDNQSLVAGVSTSTFFVPSLAAGVDYFLVTSGLRSTDFGNFNNTISGGGDILPSNTTTAVPEPFTIVGTLIGGSAALRMRKKLAALTKV